MPLFGKSKKTEKISSKSANITNGSTVVHSASVSSYIQEQTITTTTTTTHMVKVNSNLPISQSLNSLTNKNSSHSNSYSSYLNRSLPVPNIGKELLPIPAMSKLTIDAKPFQRTVTYKSTPPRTAFSGNPLSTSLNNASSYKYKTNASYATTKDLQQKLTIEVKKSLKFYDDPKETKVPTYTTRSKARGRLLLINNIKFLDEKLLRTGAQLDETNLVSLFKQMGFEIEKYRDLNKRDMEKKIINFRDSSSLKKVDIGTVIVMSHGNGKERADSTEVVCTDEKLIETTWIIDQFNADSCPYLNGKPKIFIFQCCRGNNLQGVQTDSLPVSHRPISDMLIAYSTIPGFASHRDPQNGTWYIQAICKVFMEHAHDTDVESLLKIVDSKLSTIVSGRGSKQTSSFENRGFKTCYFHPRLFQ